MAKEQTLMPCFFFFFFALLILFLKDMEPNVKWGHKKSCNFIDGLKKKKKKKGF